MDTRTTRRPLAARARNGFVTVLCLLISLAALGFIVPAAFGLERYVITGRSMTGTVDLGSVVFEKAVPAADLRVGDVITYLPPSDAGIDHLVTHRIISIDGGRLRTQGDANPTADPWTFRLTEQTQPRMAFHLPYLGYAFLALQDRTTRMIVIGVPALVIMLLSLLELVGAARRGDEAEPEVVTVAAGAADAVQVGAGPGLIPAQPGADEAGVPRAPGRLPGRLPGQPSRRTPVAENER